MGDRQTINVILTAADEDDRNRIYKLLEQTLMPIQRPLAMTQRIA